MADLKSVPYALETTADDVRPMVLEKLADAMTPGYAAEFDPADWATRAAALISMEDPRTPGRAWVHG